MKLTQEDIEKFKLLAKNKIRLIIEGQNFIGQSFKTEGFIIYDHNNPDAKRREAHSVAIFQGRYLDSEWLRGDKKDYALFFTDPDKDVKECLYISSIHTAKDNKPIFTNPDFSNIISQSIESNQEAYKEGQDLNGVAWELLPYVGKAVAERNRELDLCCRRTIVAIRCIKEFPGKIVTDYINPGFNVLTGCRRSMVATSGPHTKLNLIEDDLAGASLLIYERESDKQIKHEPKMER